MANAAKHLRLPLDEPPAKPPAEAPQPQTQPSASNGIPEDRRGFVGYVDGRFVHYCPECGEWGAHGIRRLRAGFGNLHRAISGASA